MEKLLPYSYGWKISFAIAFILAVLSCIFDGFAKSGPFLYDSLLFALTSGFLRSHYLKKIIDYRERYQAEYDRHELKRIIDALQKYDQVSIEVFRPSDDGRNCLVLDILSNDHVVMCLYPKKDEDTYKNPEYLPKPKVCNIREIKKPEFFPQKLVTYRYNEVDKTKQFC